MFWSLILEPSKRYTSTVNESFHLSMATLDVKTARKDNEVHPVCIKVDDNELLLCNLSKPHTLHASLDLEFEQGSKVTFYTNGKATIHLTGYLTQDNYSDAEDYDSLEEEEDETFSNLLDNSKGKKKAKGKEEAKLASPNKRKLEPVEVVSKKKPKNVKDQDSDSHSELDSTDDDDSSVDENELGKLVESINEDDVGTDSDDDDEEFEAEEDSDGEDDLVSDLDDSDLDSDDENSEEETPKQQQKPKKEEIKTPQQNKQNKTPVSNKKQEKPQGKNQLTNGVTPTSTKKDKKEKNQANLSNLATPKQDQKTPKKGANATPQSQKKQTVAGGVVIEELKQGDGPPAKPGKMVAVYYTGRLKNNNRVFDQSNQGPGFKFRLGNGEVIKGWDVGLSGMKVGSKRRLTIPPGMAYGNKGSPPQIPANSTLVFDVELKSIT